MKCKEYTFRFMQGMITVHADNEEDAKILARAEAIKREWNSTIRETIVQRDYASMLRYHNLEVRDTAYGRVLYYKDIPLPRTVNKSDEYIDGFIEGFIRRECMMERRYS